MLRTFNQLKNLGLFILAIALQSCIVVAEYGPPGRDGKAFYGIDYDYNPPYSYWDNNPSLPSAPFFAEYYRSNPGIYSFEYFINQTDYWYGTYQIHINRGQAGQPMAKPGANGLDTYLMMICNDDGFYFENSDNYWCDIRDENGVQYIEIDQGQYHFFIEMRRTTISERAAQKDLKYKK